jgi:uncharacterized damage-inducible protein DinB
MAMPSTETITREHADLLQALATHRHFLSHTVRDLTDAQAAERTTVSELCLGGLIKHVGDTERGWIDFIVNGPAKMSLGDDFDPETRTARFGMQPGETLAGILAEYDEVARETEAVVRSLPDLDAAQKLPEAPWFEPGAQWSARMVLLHIIAETAQHAGHADILRESIDGAKTMG